jgi:hypothetical protein
MKRLIYYIIPVLVAGATLLGRYYWFMLKSDLFFAFDWMNSNDSLSLKSVLGTAGFIVPILLVLIYLLWMLRKHKKGIEYSFIQKMFVVIAFAFFVETFVNGIFFAIILRDILGLFVAYGFTLILTVPLALILSYLWIWGNDIFNNKLGEQAND